MRISLLSLAMLAVVACGGEPTVAADPAPAEMAAPNGVGQTPAFPGQTRAPQVARASRVQTTVFASGLSMPWGIEALPDGRVLVTERLGSLRIVTADGRVLAPIAGVPAVDSRGQGGLLDVAVMARSANVFTVCLSYAQPRDGGKNATAVSCGVARGAENLTLENMRVVFQQQPAWDSPGHFGSRIVLDGPDMLFITTGERMRAEARVNAQRTDSTIGKVVRIRLDGAAPADNPFASQGGVAAQVWSLGHRNIQSAALRPATGALWTVEHGPRGGDELNKPEAGRNYGWPVITYGIDYNGRPIGEGITARTGMEQPVYYWDPVIAPSGMVFVRGKMFTDWTDNALIGGLKSEGLVRLVFEGDRVVAEERIALGGRVRDVTEAEDGAVLAAMDDGRILRLAPR